MNDVVRVSPAQGFNESLMRVLSDPNIPADKLQVVLQMQREILADRRREAFQQQFVAMAARMPRVNKRGLVELKTKDGKHLGSYKFARWEDMDEAIRPILQDFGFALTFAETPTTNGRVQVRGELMHIDGHSITSERSMPPDTGPGRNSLQAEGSAVSYCKRYLAEELCNIVREGVDDDGRSADAQTITPEMQARLLALIKEVHTQPETFLKLFVTGCEKIEDVPVRDYGRLHMALEAKRDTMKKEKEKEK